MSVPSKDRGTLSPTDRLGLESQPQCLNLFVHSIDLITCMHACPCVHEHVTLSSFVFADRPIWFRVMYCILCHFFYNQSERQWRRTFGLDLRCNWTSALTPCQVEH